MTDPDHISDGITDLVKRAQIAMDARREVSEEAQRRARETRWDDDAELQSRCLPQLATATARDLERGRLPRSAAWRALRELPPGREGILLCGPSGSGKTVAMCSVALRALERRPPPTVAYLSCASLADGSPIPDDPWWARVLLLDDIHLAGTWLPYRRAQLHALLDARREKRLFTLTAAEWPRRTLVQLVGAALTARAGVSGRTFSVFEEGVDWREQ